MNVLRRMSLSKRLWIIPSVFALALFGTIAMTVQGIAESRATGNVVDVAGRQRMLNQRHMKEVLLVSEGLEANVDGTRSLLRDSLSALTNGGDIVINPATGEEATLPPAPEGEIRSLLEQQETVLEAVFEQADVVLSTPSGSAENDQAVTQMLALGDEAHGVANAAVKEFARLSAADIDAMVRQTIIIAVIAGLIGFALAWVVTKDVIGSVRRSNDALRASAEALTKRAVRMGAGARETAEQASVVAAAGEEVSVNSQTVASAVEEMHASVQEISANAGEAREVASSAVEKAHGANSTVSQLGASTDEIGKVLEVITSIAEQTNLLALNATIEAARAGEAGKGFAVVAGEVKELAQETSKATEEITKRITAIQSDTGNAVEAIGAISEIISQISDLQNTIASAVEEQSSTTNEIARNVNEAASGSSEIAENITSVASNADQSASDAAAVEQSAHDLGDVAQQLRRLIEGEGAGSGKPGNVRRTTAGPHDALGSSEAPAEQKRETAHV